MKLKKFIVFFLIFTLVLGLCGCKSPVYRQMRKELTENGTYDAKYSQYSIQLDDGVKYYCYTDSDNIWLRYFDYSSTLKTTISFYIAFNEEIDGEYTWTMDYDDYNLRGTLDANEVDSTTEALYASSGDLPSSSALKSALYELAATLCKTCLVSLEIYWIETDSNLRLSDLGFNI